ncbi:MAG: hypothetical protein ABI673_10350 [Novosphingobium sp.]
MLNGSGGGIRIKLWGLPVRLVHWNFVLLLPLLWWTAEEEKYDLHMQLGAAPIMVPPRRAIVCAVLAAGLAYWVWSGCPLPGSA